MTPVNSNRKRDRRSGGPSDRVVLVITRDHDTIDQYTSDHDLLLRMLAGDEPAFTALYRRRQGAVYRFALQMTGSVAIAEDVTQEVFMELIEHGRRFDPSRGALPSFLYGIARNLVLRRIGKDRPAQLGFRLESGPGSGLESMPEPAMEDFAGVEDVLGDLTRRETVEQVRRAVFTLPAVYREVVVLCDLQDLSYDDAARILDCPVGTVRSRLNRGRGMLAQKLRPQKGQKLDQKCQKLDKKLQKFDEKLGRPRRRRAPEGVWHEAGRRNSAAFGSGVESGPESSRRG